MDKSEANPLRELGDIAVFLELIGDKIARWEKIDKDTVSIVLRSSHVDKLILKRQRVFFTGEKLVWELIGLFDVSSFKEATKKIKGMNEFLKNFECELRWRGWVHKKPVFVNSLSKGSHRQRSLQFRGENILANTLNSNPKLMQIISHIKIDEIKVSLKSDIVSSLGSRAYNNLTNITFFITLRKGFIFLSIGKNTRKKLQEIISVIDSIALAIKELYGKVRI